LGCGSTTLTALSEVEGLTTVSKSAQTKWQPTESTGSRTRTGCRPAGRKNSASRCEQRRSHMRTASSRTPTLPGVTCHPFCRRASAVFVRFRAARVLRDDFVESLSSQGLRFSSAACAERTGAINTDFTRARRKSRVRFRPEGASGIYAIRSRPCGGRCTLARSSGLTRFSG
jgi:hypothetical protein